MGRVGVTASKWIYFLTLFLFVLFLNANKGWCFPEMVRHGYVNCTSCHVSPGGGGVLNPYGRELSREILSTWGTQNEVESRFAYGIVKPPEWLNVMGSYRSIYAYQNTPFVQQGQYIFMQNDLEAAAQVNQWSVVASVGYQNDGSEVTAWDHLISRRHYVNYRPTDELSFRVGRFYPVVGIGTPDHVIPTKRDLGWDESMESYNIEAAWIGEKWNLYLTADLGRPDSPSMNAQTGFAVTPSIAVSDTYKLGLTYFHGNGLDLVRNIEGIWGILGFSPRFFLLTEWDVQQQSSKSGAYNPLLGVVNYQRLDYELIQGLHFYVTQNLSELDLNSAQSLTYAYGVGAQFFPRPHFEINVTWQKMRSIAISNSYTDFAWAMLNFYL